METRDRRWKRGGRDRERERTGAVGLEKPQRKTKSKKRTKRKEKPYHLSDFLPGYHQTTESSEKAHKSLSCPPSTHLSLSISPLSSLFPFSPTPETSKEICLFPHLPILFLCLLFYMIFPSNHSILILSYVHFISPSFLFFYLISL